MEPDEGAGGGGFMSVRWFGIPAPLVIAGGVVLVYLLFFRGRSGGGGSSSAGGPDTLTTGDTTVGSGAIQVTVNAGGSGDASDTDEGSDDNPQPNPPPPSRGSTVTVPNVTGQPAQMARRVLTRRDLNPAGIAKGIVTGEKPRAGTKVKKDTTVTLTGRKR